MSRNGCNLKILLATLLCLLFSQISQAYSYYTDWQETQNYSVEATNVSGSAYGDSGVSQSGKKAWAHGAAFFNSEGDSSHFTCDSILTIYGVHIYNHDGDGYVLNASIEGEAYAYTNVMVNKYGTHNSAFTYAKARVAIGTSRPPFAFACSTGEGGDGWVGISAEETSYGGEYAYGTTEKGPYTDSRNFVVAPSPSAPVSILANANVQDCKGNTYGNARAIANAYASVDVELNPVPTP